MRNLLTLFIKSESHVFATNGMYRVVFLYISDLFWEPPDDRNRPAETCCSHSVNFRW